MVTLEQQVPQMGRKTQNFRPGNTFRACPKQGFLRVSDSKTSGKTDFLRIIKLTDVKQRLRRHFLTALHGLKCERGKKILKRRGFLGVRGEKNGHFRASKLTAVNTSIVHHASRKSPTPRLSENKLCSVLKFQAWQLGFEISPSEQTDCSKQ